MNQIRTLFVAAAIAALPLCAVAQTANTPGGSATTGTPLDQTKGSPQKATPKTTQTTPDATNPSGALSSTGTTGAAAGATATTDSTGSTKASRRAARKAAAATNKPGEVPTYPAPGPDGKPTH